MNVKELFNTSKERVLTGLILMGVAVLMALMDSLFITWVILGIAYLFAFYEAMKLFGVEDQKLLIYALLIWIAAAFYAHPTDLIFIALVISFAFMAHKKEVNYKLLAPFFYPSIPMLFLFSLYKDYGMSILIWLVVIIATTDIGAYVIGKSIGKNSFSPTSPNKTWEGVIGGIVLATIAGTLVGSLHYSLLLSLIISLLVSCASVWGDLFESYLKREAGVKDSGDIFPGHGGFLDRLDGYLFGVVVMVVILRGIS